MGCSGGAQIFRTSWQAWMARLNMKVYRHVQSEGAGMLLGVHEGGVVH